MHSVVLTATGVFTPPYAISNDELVQAFNAYADLQNEQHADAIAAGERTAAVGEQAHVFGALGPAPLGHHERIVHRQTDYFVNPQLLKLIKTIVIAWQVCR